MYEHPDLDNDKEVVLWRPLLNWNPEPAVLTTATEAADTNAGSGTATEEAKTNGCFCRSSSRSITDQYMAARGISTSHGMIHIQGKGLQSHAKHGVFHTPRDYDLGERKGYRVAITARISYPDSEERLEPFVRNNSYSQIIGPEGQWQLPK